MKSESRTLYLSANVNNVTEVMLPEFDNRFPIRIARDLIIRIKRVFRVVSARNLLYDGILEPPKFVTHARVNSDHRSRTVRSFLPIKLQTNLAVENNECLGLQFMPLFWVVLPRKYPQNLFAVRFIDNRDHNQAGFRESLETVVMRDFEFGAT